MGLIGLNKSYVLINVQEEIDSLLTKSSKLLRSRYENATPNLCWVLCALLGVLCS